MHSSPRYPRWMPYMFVLCLLYLCGCGGGGSLVGGGGGSSGGLGGPFGGNGGGGGASVAIQVNFPPQGTKLADIPAGTDSIAIDVLAGNDIIPEVPTTLIHREPASTSQVATIGNLMSGPTTFVAVAYDNSGTALAAGITTTSLRGGDNLVGINLSTFGGGGPPEPVIVHVIPTTLENNFQAVETVIHYSGPFVPDFYAVVPPGGVPHGMFPMPTDALTGTTGSYVFGGGFSTPPTGVSFTGPPFQSFAPGYFMGLQLPPGEETGTYDFNLNGVTLQVVSDTPYPGAPHIVSPAHLSEVHFHNPNDDPNDPVTVTWNSAGDHVGYLLQAAVFDGNGVITRWWSNVNMQGVDWNNPSTANAFIQALPETTNADIPAGAIPPGSRNVHIVVDAFPKAAVRIIPSSGGIPVTQFLWARGESTHVVNP